MQVLQPPLSTRVTRPTAPESMAPSKQPFPGFFHGPRKEHAGAVFWKASNDLISLEPVETHKRNFDIPKALKR